MSVTVVAASSTNSPVAKFLPKPFAGENFAALMLNSIFDLETDKTLMLPESESHNAGRLELAAGP